VSPAWPVSGPVGSALTGPKPDGISELMYQVNRTATGDLVLPANTRRRGKKSSIVR